MSKSTAVTAAECKEPGLLVPLIDRNRCEGKADCQRVCPYGVFDMGVLDEKQRAELSFSGRIKSFFHGYKQAFVARGDECHACGLCVTACPEKAIKLVRRTP
jgi:4Fe-4S ferredoxin